MGIEIQVTREFIVNGKKYRSLEEVPPEYRQAIGESPGWPPGDPYAGNRGEIVVNGKRYRDESAMPDGVREIYAAAMQCIRSGQGSAAVRPSSCSKPTVPQGAASLSGRWLMLGGLLFSLFMSLLLLLLPR